MVLVRKTELACRDGWDHDLWEPKDDEHEVAIPAPVHAGARSGSGHMQRDSPLNGRETRNVDTVVSIEHDRGNREGLESEASDPNAVSDAVQQKDDFHSDVRSRKGLRAWSSSLDAAKTDFGSQWDEVRGESVSGRETGSDENWRQFFGDLRQQTSADDQERRSQTGMSPDDRRFSDMDTSSEGSVRGDTPDESGRPVSWDTESPRSTLDRFGARSISGDDYRYSEPVEQSGLTDQFDVPEEVGDHSSPEAEAAPEPEFVVDEGFGFDLEEPESLVGASGIVQELRIPSSVQQQTCCRTCRDFIPNDDGKTGWCNNPHAFDKRQEVTADVVSCKGTFGSWWTPSDDWWLERADISHHSRPTPLVKELIRDIRESRDEGSTSGTKRS